MRTIANDSILSFVASLGALSLLLILGGEWFVRGVLGLTAHLVLFLGGHVSLVRAGGIEGRTHTTAALSSLTTLLNNAKTKQGACYF